MEKLKGKAGFKAPKMLAALLVVLIIADFYIYRSYLHSKSVDHMQIISTEINGDTKIQEFVNNKTGKRYRVYNKNGLIHIENEDKTTPISPVDHYYIMQKI